MTESYTQGNYGRTLCSWKLHLFHRITAEINSAYVRRVFHKALSCIRIYIYISTPAFGLGGRVGTLPFQRQRSDTACHRPDLRPVRNETFLLI